MAVLETIDDTSVETLKTTISVHSPLTEISTKGNCYTSYAISLNSNNSCFSLPHSNLRRRFSEFAHLRRLLKSHHPTIEPPHLPRKGFFSRFAHVFIEERITGLHKFLEEIINTPVYLSNKGVHLFLQSSCSMSEIVEQVSGDVPAPKLMNPDSMPYTFHSDSSSTCSSEISDSRSFCNEVKDIVPNISKSKEAAVDFGDITEMSTPLLQGKALSPAIPILNRRKKLPRGKLNYNSISPSNSDSGNSSEDSTHSRKVSFNDKVTVAVVSNHLWNYGVQPIQTGA